jgi:hypothetical protein
VFSLVSLVLSVSTRKSKKILEHRSGKIYFCLCNEISTPQPKKERTKNEKKALKIISRRVLRYIYKNEITHKKNSSFFIQTVMYIRYERTVVYQCAVVRVPDTIIKWRHTNADGFFPTRNRRRVTCCRLRP